VVCGAAVVDGFAVGVGCAVVCRAVVDGFSVVVGCAVVVGGAVVVAVVVGCAVVVGAVVVCGKVQSEYAKAKGTRRKEELNSKKKMFDFSGMRRRSEVKRSSCCVRDISRCLTSISSHVFRRQPRKFKLCYDN